MGGSATPGFPPIHSSQICSLTCQLIEELIPLMISGVSGRMIRILTWNVNSVRKRVAHLCSVLTEHHVDIALLQETKCTDDQFPLAELEDLGYKCYIHGQKSRNGVAILSKYPIVGELCNTVFDAEEEIGTVQDTGSYSVTEARYLECLVDYQDVKVRVASVYVPNGQEVDTETFVYKLNFLRCLKARLLKLLAREDWLVIGGDYNVAPDDIDVYDAQALDGKLCFHPKERAGLREILHLGFTDAFRILHEGKQEFSWWNYREGSWQRNRGMRIDHLLLSPNAVDKLVECSILSSVRGLESPSDHAPVMCVLRKLV
ncbi:exodeoxyribonuclease III [Anaplasma marginale str. Dawn]|uniref:Exodeoxyribonuclease III (XthA2) n=3 Tax=Anaplasma marginale TaxID=770 RepID=B9KII9_ANAMF|nr:exodeoxyribonuclease III (xthA2) [Anaplasma marginale str. Florida]AGZ78839.1 exodeoxyribonuclease III [Anaplasma marginale str. Gypsy Plains]AGZ79671.1 exodeoxyribonuclease III [Anaplasma marginale str. Dawn]